MKVYLKGLVFFIAFVLLSTVLIPLSLNMANLSFASRAGEGKISGYIGVDFTYPATSEAVIKSGFKVEIPGTQFSSETNSSGYFEINGVSGISTPYSIKISKPNYLSRMITDITSINNVQIGSSNDGVVLWAGDISVNGVQDDAINMADIMELTKSFNTQEGTSAFNSNCDLNKDQVINMADIMIIAKYFNKISSDYPRVSVIIPTPTYVENTSTPTPTSTPVNGIGLWASSITDTTVTLNWTDSNNGTDYQVYMNDNWKAWTSSRTYTVTGLTKGTTYKFYVIGGAVKSDTINVVPGSEGQTSTPTPTATGINSGTPVPSGTPTPKPTLNRGELNITFDVTSEDATSFTAKMVVSNPNTSYAWNGTYFGIYSIECDTTSQITQANTPGGAVAVTKQGDVVTFDLGWQSTFPYGKSVELTVQGTKGGTMVYPQNFRTNYVSSKDIIYPKYQGLPSTWSKGKADLKAEDLIDDPSEYYKQDVGPITDTYIMYNPPSKTQMLIGEPLSIGYPVNGRNDVRIRIPTPYMAMGLAFGFEQFKVNPNYVTALGTKENWAAGIIPQDPGFPGIPLEIDGQMFNWPIAIEHPDGPFQQESPNFNEAAMYFPDYYPPAAKHGDFIKVSMDMKNSNWVSAPICSAMSTMVTREVLNAARGANYNEFMTQAKDPWAEFIIITFGYNRGIGSLYERKLFSTNRDKAINSADLCTDLDMGGFASHIPTVRAVVDAMNKSVDRRYDAEITWEDMEGFFQSLRKFYANGVPTDAEWNTMIEDVHNAFDVLSQHWGKPTVSYRYDFLTLIRVAKQHLPQPYNTRPTSEQWFYTAKNANP